jgi:hypothetical protein
MAELIGTIASTVSKLPWGNILKGAEGGMAGAGLIGNLLTAKKRSDELNYLKQQQAALQDPTKLAAQVRAATQPLNLGLTEAVGNQVSASLAEQGLSQAPGIQATVLGQALAPFQQQNQETALRLVMERLGLPLQYAQAYLQGLPQPTNLAPLMWLLQQPKGGAMGGGGGTTAAGTPPFVGPMPFDYSGGYPSVWNPPAGPTSTGDFGFPGTSTGGFPAVAGPSSTDYTGFPTWDVPSFGG